uniref:Thyrotropin-releasing hormone receptor n=1 Tax=Romanomermis culicivorax TaxID=13658 RepID=A0A915IZN9_ROMCU
MRNIAIPIQHSTFCLYRFLAIAVPFKVHILCTMTKMKLWLATLWICGLIYAMPYFIYHRIEWVPDRPDFHRCRFRAPPEIIFYKSFECLIFYFLPLLIITLLYSRMVQILWWSSNRKTLIFMDGDGLSQNKKKIPRPVKSGGGRKCILTSSTNDSSFNLTAENLRSRKNVIKMLISCVLIYFICYSPIQAIFIATFFHVKVETSFVINLILHCLAYGCSAANPLLYSIFCKKFRDKFHFLLNYWKTAKNAAERSESASNRSTSGIAAEVDGVETLCGNNRKCLVVSLSPKGSSSRSRLEECQLLTDLHEPNTSQFNLSGSYGAIFRNAGAEDESNRRSRPRVSFGILPKK